MRHRTRRENREDISFLLPRILLGRSTRGSTSNVRREPEAPCGVPSQRLGTRKNWKLGTKAIDAINGGGERMNPKQEPVSISNLSADQKRQLLAQLLEKKKGQQTTKDKQDRKTLQTFPVSFAQQRLWFMDQLQPDSAVYHLPAAFRVTGRLDVAVLEQSFNTIIQRHEILRTRIVVVDEQPVQEIADVQPLSLTVEEIQESTRWESQQHQNQALQAVIRSEASRPFDLAEGPLLRVCVFHLKSGQEDRTEHLLICTLHHIIADYWSMRVLVQELGRAYGAIASTQTPHFPDLPIQYADYAVWQRQWLQGDHCKRQLAYWQQQLHQPPLSLQLPTDFPRPSVQNFNGAVLSFSLPNALSHKLNDLSRSQGTTLFMTLLMGFKILLYRYSGQTDILVGSTVANRNRPELANLIGLLVNNLVFRSDVSGNPTVRSLLAQIRDTTLDAYTNQDLPFEYLVEVLQPERHLHQNPLFQVMFVLHNTPETAELKLPDLTLSYIPLDTQTTRFDLSLDMVETTEGLLGNLEYNTELFKPTTIQRMVGHFQTLLEAITTDLDQPITHLPLLTPAEQEQLLTWGTGHGVSPAGETTRYTAPAASHDTKKQTDEPQRVHEWVEYWAGQTPNAPAVSFGDRTTTYKELDQQVNQLAHHLLSLDVQPGKLVGVCVERLPKAWQRQSPHMLIALLAIHKAGATYVPIDPTYPPERIQYVLDDAGIKILISDSSNFQSLGIQSSDIQEFRHIDIYADSDVIHSYPTVPPQLPNSPTPQLPNSLTPLPPNTSAPSKIQNPESKIAYTIYTSGSTGHPKGVQILHSALSNLLQSMAEAPGFDANDKLLAVTTFSFDIAALELFLPLVCGGQVVIASQDDVRDGDRLISLLNHHDITVMQATPATWRLLLASGWQGKANLRMLCGGEALDAPLAAQLLSKGRSLWNLYGPTETTIWSLCHQVTPADVEGKATVPIGRAIANTELHVLDPYLQPVPVGIPGELYIGGTGVAAGYLNRPELTRDRFMPKPNRSQSSIQIPDDSQTPQKEPWDLSTNALTLYKTGDSVRYRDDGILEYLGRLDFQVKLRGFRIELGEIEAALSRHPRIQQAVVVLREQDSDPTLVAYLVPTLDGGETLGVVGHGNVGLPSSTQPTGRTLKSTELRAFLKQSLPAYMVPSVFVPMNTLPLTPNGKVDRQSLPAPSAEADPQQEQDYVAPTTDTEIELARIWADVLERDAIGIRDNFFELGGHSLLAARAIARIRQAFSIDIPLQTVFTSPTIAGLAREVEVYCQQGARLTDTPTERPQPYRPDIHPISREGNLPLSFAQQRQWVLCQLEPDNPFYNIPVGLRISGELAIERLRQSVVTLLHHHEGLRTTVETLDGQPKVSIMAVPESYEFPVIDLTKYSEIEKEERVKAIAQQDAQTPFTLDHGPLFRLSLLRLASTQHIALLTLHHLIADAWSIGIIVQDIAQFYATSHDNDDDIQNPKSKIVQLASTVSSAEPRHSASSQSRRAYTEVQNPKSKIQNPKSLQYLDYAAWQRTWLQGDVLDKQLAYWRSHLHNAPPLLELPTDYPRPAIQTWNGDYHSVHLPKALSQAVRRWSQQQGVTVFMTLLAVFKLLLQCYGDSDDIVVGTPVANRHHAEVERVVGCFANTLALRTDLSGHPSFAELVERVKHTTLNGYDHQDLPFEQIVDALQPERSLSHSPLFQVMFLLQNAPTGSLEIDGLSWQVLERDSGTAKFDLTLSVTEVAEESTTEQDEDGPQSSIGLVARWEYNQDLFTANTIQRIAVHWQMLLERAIAHPTQPITTLAILTPEEQQQILFDWNRLPVSHSASVSRWESPVQAPSQGMQEESQSLLIEFPAGDWEPGMESGAEPGGLHQYFEAQVKRTPEAIALTFNQQQITYRTLNQRANQLAIYLQQLGIQVEDLVGVCIDRSIEMVVALLAILKAGAAYVPLDPNYPAERLKWIVEDAQLSAFIRQSTDTRTEALIQSRQESTAGSEVMGNAHPTSNLPTIINIDSDWDIRTSKSKIQNPKSKIHSSSLAYVIYTSGSTGKPKGVAIAHQNAIALIDWAKATFSAKQLTGVLASTSICFDLSVFELFVPLSLGGTVILVEDILQLPSLTATPTATTHITLINTVPSAARALLAIDGIPSTVTTVNLAGEPLPQPLVDQLYERPHIQAVYNLYGPSEDTTYSTVAKTEVKAEDRRQKAKGKAEGRRLKAEIKAEDKNPKSKIQDPKSKTPPIGKPITGTQTYVLDRHLRPVPVGVPGELYLAGSGVARGYLNRPDLTSDRFIPNPFAVNRSQGSIQTRVDSSNGPPKLWDLRLYKTGDRVRYRPNGDIEYLRRLDHQVKIRGFRIELGEIEAVLRQHPAVAQVVVNPWIDEENQHQQLVAYVVAKDTEETKMAEQAGQAISSAFCLLPSAFKAYLQSRIPDYMVPSTIMVLDALPLTPNGKIDRRSLPAPDRSSNADSSGTGTDSNQPQTQREEQLADIWRRLLGVEQVGIHDNFFALGGDSILAIQAIAKAGQVGIHLAPKQLFQYQTIAELAALDTSMSMVQAEQGLVTGTVPLTPIQHWFFEQEFANSHHWNQAIMLDSLEPIDPQILRQAVQQLLQHHDGLRSQFIQSGNNRWQQVIPATASDVVTQIDLTAIPADQQSLVIEQTNAALQTGFDLVTGGLIRIAVFETSPEKTQLLITLHHLLVDGLSWRIILADLQQIYRDLSQHQVAALPPKSVSLRQWTQTLRDYAQSEEFTQERNYWATFHHHLAQKHRMLPLDFPDGSNQMLDSSTLSVALTREETDALLHQVPHAYQTQINDVLLTALMVGLTDWTRQDHLVLELEGHGREALTDGVDLSRTVGWLTTLFPVVLNRSQSDDLGIILKSVKEQLRDIPNRGIGYGLWRYFSPDDPSRDNSRILLSPSVRFNYLGQTDAVWSDGFLFEPSRESVGRLRSPHGDRVVILEINALVIEGSLRLDWSYSSGLHRQETVHRVVGSVMDCLRQLIDHCCAPDAGGYTPSDFPEMDLSQGELDALLADL